MNIAHLAEWIRWAGVAVAVAGVLIATPDGVSEVWRHIREPGWLSRLLAGLPWPFNLRGGGPRRVTARQRVEFSTSEQWPTDTPPWEPGADDQRKIEVLHVQHTVLVRDIVRFRTDTLKRLQAVQADLREAEARLRSTHEELEKTLAAKDRRAAQIDARGLWPIGFGILLTGIPAELAHFPALGIVVGGLAVVLTVSLALAGISARRTHRPVTEPQEAVPR